MHSETLSVDRSVLRDLRRTRQRRRLGDVEWFDIAYRVYLFALGGLIAVVLASDAIDGFIGDDVTTDDLLARGPSIAGVAVIIAAGLGLRSGADGGPISIETADIRHVLLAPIGRRSVMIRPVVQRLRSAMFSLGLAAGIVGQFVAREVEGSRAAWAAAGALFGAVVGAAFVSCAVIAHAMRLPRWAATMILVAGLGWQVSAAIANWRGTSATATHIGPANLGGGLALWGIRQRGVDVAAIVTVVGAVAVALVVAGRLRIEPLERRGRLVSQLRFAATVQDMRTVVLLRRQLRAESLRTKQWGARSDRQRDTTSCQAPSVVSTGSRKARMIWVRGIRSLRRLPASRLGRIVALSIAAGAASSLAVSSSPLFAIGVVAALFLLGMEAIEPLSQEVDRPDITDGLPVERGWVYSHHLVAPGALLAIAALIGAAAASVVEPAHAAGAFAICIPVAWLGGIGPAVGAVLDTPTPISVANTTLMGAPRDQESAFVPPEFAGFSQAFSTFMPIALTAIGVVPVFAMRAEPTAATVGRCVVGTVLVLALMVVWIRRRDRWGVKIRAFFEAGRAERATSS